MKEIIRRLVEALEQYAPRDRAVTQDLIAEARKLLEGDGQQKPMAYVLHKAVFDGSPYFTVALANEADALFKDGYDIHQYLYLGPEPPQPPKG